MLKNGQLVCTNAILEKRNFTKKEASARKPNTLGMVVGYSDSHGLCYEVRHEKGDVAWYDPDELQKIAMNEICLMVYELSQMGTEDPRDKLVDKICACLQILSSDKNKRKEKR